MLSSIQCCDCTHCQHEGNALEAKKKSFPPSFRFSFNSPSGMLEQQKVININALNNLRTYMEVLLFDLESHP